MMQAAEGQLLYIAVQEKAAAACTYINYLETPPPASDQLLYVFCTEEASDHCLQVMQVSHSVIYCSVSSPCMQFCSMLCRSSSLPSLCW